LEIVDKTLNLLQDGGTFVKQPLGLGIDTSEPVFLVRIFRCIDGMNPFTGLAEEALRAQQVLFELVDIRRSVFPGADQCPFLISRAKQQKRSILAHQILELARSVTSTIPTTAPTASIVAVFAVLC
jgi:hypothetical protein